MDIPSETDILNSIDLFLERHGMAPSRFGRDATGDPQLINSIRRGRSPSLKVLQQIAEFMRRYELDNNASVAPLSSGKASEIAA